MKLQYQQKRQMAEEKNDIVLDLANSIPKREFKQPKMMINEGLSSVTMGSQISSIMDKTPNNETNTDLNY
jgi:hypothetical protein